MNRSIRSLTEVLFQGLLKGAEENHDELQYFGQYNLENRTFEIQVRKLIASDKLLPMKMNW
jgi:hypothetical protein